MMTVVFMALPSVLHGVTSKNIKFNLTATRTGDLPL